MPSPFSSFSNSTLQFQVASGTLTPDSKGNMKPGTAIVELTALLQQKRDPNEEPLPGVDRTAIWVEGYIVSIANQDDLVLPSVVTPDSPCAATWQGRQGRFFMQFNARNPYLAALSIDLVERLKGYFQIGSFVVSGEPWEPSPSPTPTTDSNFIQVPFAFGDASPKPIATIATGKTIFTATVVIQTPFNGIGAALALGDGGIGDRLIQVAQNDPTFAAEYEANPAHTYLAETQILLTITPGEGCTQGGGYVLLEV